MIHKGTIVGSTIRSTVASIVRSCKIMDGSNRCNILTQVWRFNRCNISAEDFNQAEDESIHHSCKEVSERSEHSFLNNIQCSEQSNMTTTHASNAYDPIAFCQKPCSPIDIALKVEGKRSRVWTAQLKPRKLAIAVEQHSELRVNWKAWK